MIRPARKGLRTALVLLSAMGCLTAMPALAGPLLDAATKAEEKAKSGDQIGAYDIMRNALSDFAATLPLTIGKGIFVADVPTAYGIYTPRADSTFKPGEKLITYVEPIGLTWKPADGGKMQTNFTVDFELMDTKGEVLAGQKTFGNFSFIGYVRNQEIFTHLTLDISGAPPGDYLLRYTLNDTGSERTVKIDQPFKIAPK